MTRPPARIRRAARAQAVKEAAATEQGGGFQYGAIPLGENLNNEVVWAVLEVDEAELASFLRAQAHQNLPPGTRYEIRKGIPSNFGGTKQMAWYRNASMAGISDWTDGAPGNESGPVEAVHVPEGGYYRVGRYTTPMPADGTEAVPDGARH